MSFRLRLLNIKKIINLEIILMFNYNLTDRIRKKYVFSDQIKYLPFGTFMCCFGSSRKVGISLSLSEVLFDNISGKRISLSSRFVSLIVSSRIEKTNQQHLFLWIFLEILIIIKLMNWYIVITNIGATKPWRC